MIKNIFIYVRQFLVYFVSLNFNKFFLFLKIGFHLKFLLIKKLDDNLRYFFL